MNRTRIIFFVVIAVAIVIVGIGLIARSLGPADQPDRARAVQRTDRGARGHRAADRDVGDRSGQSIQRREAHAGRPADQSERRADGRPDGAQSL